MKHLLVLLHQHRFRILVALFVLLSINLGILIVPVEQMSSEANIENFEDGVWWSITTMTGVGYGDRYPVTTAGRMIGVVLEVVGIVVFGLIAAHIAVALFNVRDDFYWKRMFARLDEMERKLERMDKQQHFLVKNGEDDGEKRETKKN